LLTLQHELRLVARQSQPAAPPRPKLLDPDKENEHRVSNLSNWLYPHQDIEHEPDEVDEDGVV
jgi:hypothetical protein